MSGSRRRRPRCGGSATTWCCSTRDAVRAEVRLSPLSRRAVAAQRQPASSIRRGSHGAWRVARALGVRLHEGSRVTRLRTAGAGLRVTTAAGEVQAAGPCSTTGAFRSPVRAVRRRIVPVWDYVLVDRAAGRTRGARRSAGRTARASATAANQFHYYRLTADDRIVWGGYDAVYNFANGVGPHLHQRDATFARLAQHFFTTFPQLEGMRFTHRWGGPIDTCSRFFAFFGTRTAAASPTPPGTPGSASARAASAPASRSTCWPGAAPRRRAALRAHPAGAVPARAAALGRDPADAQPARRRRPPAGPPRPVAAAARPSRARLRQL